MSNVASSDDLRKMVQMPCPDPECDAIIRCLEMRFTFIPDESAYAEPSDGAYVIGPWFLVCYKHHRTEVLPFDE